MEILSFGVQAPGLDPGVGEMFRFVGPTPGNRALFLRIALLPSQICKEFSIACNSACGYIAVAPAKVGGEGGSVEDVVEYRDRLTPCITVVVKEAGDGGWFTSCVTVVGVRI